MVLEQKDMMMELNIKENLKIIKKKELDIINGKMELLMKENL